ncbi:hypothetical protein BDV59DRAFT_174607 [Aspergillus ambiguus]|uniref:uncharacterized protein n=1 Tax=Aspergillus ambiguus TaxID=176160 RepID=UPI003CCD004B
MTGWEIYASHQQDDRNNWHNIAVQLGRELSATPAHLSRALYVPRHDSSLSHLRLYDISMRYAETVRDAPIGSSKYTVSLGLMKRPRDDGGDDLAVVCNADLIHAGDREIVIGSVQYRGQPTEPCPEVEIAIGTADSEICCVTMQGRHGSNRKVSMTSSYPISASETREGTFKHPYFSFSVPREPGMPTFQWQIHPVEHGPLRYTLVCIPPEGAATGESQVQAIYHHIGLGVSLSQPHSEGVLLLAPSTSAATSAIIVATALAMLWELRRLDSEYVKKRNDKKMREAKANSLRLMKAFRKGKNP